MNMSSRAVDAEVTPAGRSLKRAATLAAMLAVVALASARPVASLPSPLLETSEAPLDPWLEGSVVLASSLGFSRGGGSKDGRLDDLLANLLVLASPS